MDKNQELTEEWLNSPIESTIGTIWLAGQLSGKNAIPKNKMRILGRFALILVLDGDIYYKDGTGIDTILTKGHALFVSPDLPHAYGGLRGTPWSQSYFVFDGPQFELLQNAESIHSKQPFWNLKSVASWNDRLKELILAPHDEQSSGSAIRRISQFSNTFVQMITKDHKTSESQEGWLKKSTELLGRPINEHWLLPQTVAKQVGMSYENFRKQFTQRAGMPPAKYQRQRKIDRACAAIYRGSVNFKELAEELEFCDVYHFSKAFRQIKGIPPSSYRRSVRGQ